MTLPWFIPQLRNVEFEDDDDNSVINVIEKSKIGIDISDTKSDISEESTIAIKEYRDEANRPWWKFFDEFEYRYTTTESKKHDWWRWFEKGTSKEEKKLILKLDASLALYAFIGYWIKYVDSANLNNAYVSGLQEGIGMKGNDLINTQVLFTVGQIIFELPWIFLLPRVSLPYALFVCELVWATFTLVTYRAENPATLKAFRFIIGAAEACYFPIIHYSLASFYTATEIGRRGALFYCGQFLGVLTSGLLQAAASKIPNPGDSLSGWQWMFIIDGIISFAVAFLALIMHPGTPLRCYSIWLTDDEIKLARSRMKKNGSDVSPTVKSFFDKGTWKAILSSWHFWLLSICNMFGFNTNSASSGSFSLWLKSLDRFSVARLNNLTTIPPGLGLIWILIVCVGADLTRKRFGFIILSFIMNFIANFILALWHVPETAKWAGYLLAYWSWSQSSVFNPLISDILRHDNNQRAIEWMAIYIIGLQSSAWINRLTFPTVESPRFKKGFSSCAAFSLCFVITVSIIYVFYKRDEKKNALKNGIYIYDSSKGESPPTLEEKLERDSL
ncbi:hypothetical protein PSN45_004759 [Yamadazyma tenuis]|uniref:MFS general substrate transporter n=1 Tax=Candida tenuis (strain ATCC 10573 / BCRC 21748 / CBS 615 / JCM 9827 / NBRC 10315 / NRRL Y-1498 / VKM Y-70) TaxID=590646 RepID=G3B6M7_CANTC|nr:uncharacterized protein CANTEDRAFT_122573 [Yamadazyma tenuis ATCC 10573]EGV62972.1 hypothetical protein CANTEDRAFT_122573 [Yamadazyma tenuis ATCC 10573]WEJ97211.1 hypothetical protein PSN45_004759 [Yamadazyma tenuis]